MKLAFLLILLSLSTFVISQDGEDTVPTSTVRTRFESVLQQFREELDNPSLKTFGTQKQQNKFRKLVEQATVWLEKHGETAQEDEFRTRFIDIQSTHTPIVNRSFEYKDRDDTYRQANEILQEVYNRTVELQQSQPWVADKTDAYLIKLNATKQWIKANYLRQKEKKLNENILFYNYQMLSKAEEIKEIYETIKSIPNPQSEVETEINGESSESVLQHQQVQTEESPKQQQETSNDL